MTSPCAACARDDPPAAAAAAARTCTRARSARSTSCPTGRCCWSPPTGSPPTTTCCPRPIPDKGKSSPSCRCGGSSSSPTWCRTTWCDARRPGRSSPAGRCSAERLDDAPGRVRRPRLPGRVGLADYQRDRARSAGSRCRRAGRGLPAAGADLHPGDEGAARASTTRTSPSTSVAAAVGADAAAELRAHHARGVPARRGARRASGGIIARRHQDRARLDARTARCCWPTRCSRPTRPGSGRPTSGSRAARSRRSTSSSSATGWTRRSPAGTAHRGAAPPPELPDWVVERTRDLYIEAYERITGDRWP